VDAFAGPHHIRPILFEAEATAEDPKRAKMRKDWPVNNQNLPELVLIEGIQLVAMKRDESISPSLFTFRSHFAVIHRD